MFTSATREQGRQGMSFQGYVIVAPGQGIAHEMLEFGAFGRGGGIGHGRNYSRCWAATEMAA
jgi:hypothetical protein